MALPAVLTACAATRPSCFTLEGFAVVAGADVAGVAVDTAPMPVGTGVEVLMRDVKVGDAFALRPVLIGPDEADSEDTTLLTDGQGLDDVRLSSSHSGMSCARP